MHEVEAEDVNGQICWKQVPDHESLEPQDVAKLQHCAKRATRFGRCPKVSQLARTTATMTAEKQ